MPSAAAKRRKAAKKKKEKEANSDLAINDALGNEDVESREEVSSPLSDDHHNPYDRPPVLQLDVAEKNFPDVTSTDNHRKHFEDDIVVMIENESKYEDDLPSKVGIESGKDSKEGDDRSSSLSSSSSEDESRVTKNYEDGSKNSYAAEKINPFDQNEFIAAEKTIHIVENQGPENVLSTYNDETKSEDDIVVMIENESKYEDDLPSKIGIESAESESRVTDNKSADRNMILKTNIYDGESENLYAEDDSALPDDFAVEKTINIVDNQGLENILSSHNDPAKCSLASIVECEENGNENLRSSRIPVSQTSNGEEQVRHYEIPECSESQPVVGPGPRLERRTFILSCCGLFDALIASKR